MSRPRKALFLAAFLAALCRSQGSAASGRPAASALPPGVRLQLPPGASAEWALLPGTAAARVTAPPPAPAPFDVDPNGAPWFGGREFAWTEDGRLLVIQGKALGFLEAVAGQPPRFRPALNLPHGALSLRDQGGGLLYLFGRDPGSGRSKVYRLRPGTGKDEVAAVKVYSGPDPVTAVAGDGQTTYVATGRLVLKVGAVKDAVEGVFAHRSETITDLAYSADAGLFFATRSHAGFAAERPHGFLSAPGTQVRLRGGSLYASLGEGRGVLRIRGLEAFRKLERLPLPKGLLLELPSDSGIQASWVLPPGLAPADMPAPSRFEVDKGGLPWLALEKRYLFNPLLATSVAVAEPFEDFAALADGSFLVSTAKAVGALERPAASARTGGRPPPSPIRALFRLPRAGFRLFAGSQDSLYLLGPGGGKSPYELFSLAQGGMARLFSAKEPITAVAGDGTQTVVAVGRKVYRLEGGNVQLLFVHPGSDVVSLAFAGASGVFYATASEVGHAGPGGFRLMLKARRCALRLRDNALFLYIGDPASVLRLDGVDRFAAKR